MEIDKKSMKKMFPNLIKELEGDENKVRIDSVRSDPLKAEEEVMLTQSCWPKRRLLCLTSSDIIIRLWILFVDATLNAG